MAVEFDEDRGPLSVRMPVEATGSITKFFLATGVVKNVREAQVVMLVVALAALAAGAYFFMTSPAFKKQAIPATPEEVQESLREMSRTR